jgi:hypothetical protein
VNERLFTAVLAQEDLDTTPLVEHYRRRGAEPVICDEPGLLSQGYEVMRAPLQGTRPSATLRHDPRSVASAVLRFYRKHRRDS